MNIPSTKQTKQTKNRKQLTKMSSTSKTPPVAQAPSQPVKGELTKTTTKTPTQAATKAPTKTTTVTGLGVGGSNTMNCYHDWILCSHPTIPYTSTFCQHCGVEKR